MVNVVMTLIFAAQGATILKLNQKDAAVMALQKSLKAQEISQKYAQLSSNPILARGNFEWKLNIESGYQKDRTNTLTRLGDFTFESYVTTTSLTKSFLTGTTLTFALSRTSQKTDYVATNSGTANPNLTYDSGLITFEQALFGNAFGRADRALLAKADLQLVSDLFLRADELQNVVLDALRLYWNTSVAQENLKESLAARDRYQKLVETVKRKSGLGYANPGEFSQVQAEYESRVQAVKQASLDYVSLTNQFSTLLQIPPDTDIEFVITKELPPLPHLEKLAAENTRTIKSQKYKLQSVTQDLLSTESRSGPFVSLVAKSGASGVDESPQTSFNQLTSQNHNLYYVGAKLTYAFGEGYHNEQLKQARSKVNEETFRLERLAKEKQDLISLAEQKVMSSRQIAESYQRQFQFREKAADELTRTYNQGRTDISLLIDNINKLLVTEVQMLRAYGDYSIALNEWAAVRDELIPSEEPVL